MIRCAVGRVQEKKHRIRIYRHFLQCFYLFTTSNGWMSEYIVL